MDVVVLWDAEDETTDIYLQAGLMVAKAIAASARSPKSELGVDFAALDKAILEVRRQSPPILQARGWLEARYGVSAGPGSVTGGASQPAAQQRPGCARLDSRRVLPARTPRSRSFSTSSTFSRAG